MMARILTILAVLLAPVAVFTPTAAHAQMEGSLVCSSSQSFAERWRTRRYYGTDNGQEYQNNCDFTIKLYFCLSYDPNPESCSTAGQFQYVVLRPGARQRIYPTARNSEQYVHNIQCGESDTLVDWRSQYTQAKGPRCKFPMPANVNRSAYPGTGTPANPSAPVVSLRNGSSLMDGSEYPMSLLGTLVEGRTVAAIAVGTNGRATGCHITSSSGYYEMDKAACDVFMRRARFSFPTDASGAAVPGFFEGKITWTAP